MKLKSYESPFKAYGTGKKSYGISSNKKVVNKTHETIPQPMKAPEPYHESPKRTTQGMQGGMELNLMD